MPFLVINLSNAYDPSSIRRFPDVTTADAAARQTLANFPQQDILVVQELYHYKTSVTITADDPEPFPEPEPEPVPEVTSPPPDGTVVADQ